MGSSLSSANFRSVPRGAKIRIDPGANGNGHRESGKRDSAAETTRAGSMRKVALLLWLFALTSCAEKTIYLRTDGQDMTGNPALHQQFELDRAVCQGEPGDDKDCMAVKGYVSVPKEQAAAKQRQLAAIAAQSAEHETVSELPPLRSTTPPKTPAG